MGLAVLGGERGVEFVRHLYGVASLSETQPKAAAANARVRARTSLSREATVIQYASATRPYRSSLPTGGSLPVSQGAYGSQSGASTPVGQGSSSTGRDSGAGAGGCAGTRAGGCAGTGFRAGTGAGSAAGAEGGACVVAGVTAGAAWSAEA